MSDRLSREQRLVQNVTRLKNSLTVLRNENKELKKTLKEKDQEIADLRLKLEDKELQRKNLLTKMYKSSSCLSDDERKQLGKKSGEKGFCRPDPPDSNVTEEIKYIPNHCPYCKQSGTLLPEQQTVVKYQEDIVIVPEKIVKKYIITKYWCTCCKEYVDEWFSEDV